VKRLILIGLVGAITLGCVLVAPAPSCWHGVACRANTGDFDIVRAAELATVVGGFILVVRAGWITLQLGRALRRLPRARPRPELEGRRVECIASCAPVAFCAGALRPRVYVTESLVELLDPRALAAVIAHEQAHARRLDPLRRTLLAALSDLLLNAPWVLWLRYRHGERAEKSAHRTAATLVGPYAVTDALTALAMGDADASAGDAEVDPIWPSGHRPIVVSLAATLLVAMMLLCLSHAALLLDSGRLPHL
jgi:hypothetical protein